MRAFRNPAALLAAVLVIGCADGPTSPPSDVTLPQLSRSDNRASPGRGAPTLDWVEELFIDYGADPSHAGPGPDPDDESATFKLTQGGIRWPASGAGDVVEYKITGGEDADDGDGNDDVEDALLTYGLLINRAFVIDPDPPDNLAVV